MEQIERITHMEEALDAAAAAVNRLAAALEQYDAAQERLQELSAYYGSPQWLQDFDDDSAGKIPRHIKRGVLSEDGVDHLLSEVTELKAWMKRLAD